MWNLILAFNKRLEFDDGLFFIHRFIVIIVVANLWYNMILVQDVLLTSILFISAMYVYKHLACNFLSITNESSDSKKIDERVFTRKKN